MKHTTAVIALLFLLYLLAACGGTAGMSEDEQFAAAQQTLDALNAGQPAATEPPATQAPATQVPATATAAATAPASSGFDAALGAWQSIDTDGSIQTVTFAAAGDNLFSFAYHDQGASVCGLDESGSPIHGFSVTGTGSADGNTFSAPDTTGICEDTGKQFTADWKWTYRPDSDTLTDPSGRIWDRGNGETVSSTRIIDLDNDGPQWDNNCNAIRQPMGEFGDGWLEDDQLFGAGLNCDLGFDLQIAQSGTYDVYLSATYAPDFGLMHLTFQRGSQNDDIFNIALYDPTIRPTGEIPLGQWHFNADETNNLMLAVYDKQPESTDYKFGLDYLKLVLIDPDF